MASTKQARNGNRLEETTALLQQAMATLLQNQVLFTARMDAMNDRFDRKFAEIDRRFVEIDRRLENIESYLQKMFTELPTKVFGFGQAASKNPPALFQDPSHFHASGCTRSLGDRLRSAP